MSELYLDLMTKCLTDYIYCDNHSIDKRINGKDWPDKAHTMVGMNRLNNVRFCVEDVLTRNVPGDMIEAGAWRGGVVILMRAILKAYGDNTRKVWVADSFTGVPKPSVNYPQDANNYYHTLPHLIVSLEEVKNNFRKYDLLDNQVKFLPGLFQHTLPSCTIEKLSILRIDGDMYESTITVFNHLYDKLSIGGYVIADDYFWIEGCRQAIDDFRESRGIVSAIQQVDWSAGYWIKEQ